MGNLFHVKGGSGRGDSTFLLILTCRVFLYIYREGGGTMHLLSTPDLFPHSSPREGSSDFLGGGGGIFIITLCIPQSALHLPNAPCIIQGSLLVGNSPFHNYDVANHHTMTVCDAF